MFLTQKTAPPFVTVVQSYRITIETWRALLDKGNNQKYKTVHTWNGEIGTIRIAITTDTKFHPTITNMDGWVSCARRWNVFPGKRSLWRQPQAPWEAGTGSSMGADRGITGRGHLTGASVLSSGANLDQYSRGQTLWGLASSGEMCRKNVPKKHPLARCL